MKNAFYYTVFLLVMLMLTSCSLGFLLFYKEARSAHVYRSSSSKKNYYTINAVTLSHCGCTYLTAANYVNKELTFRIFQHYANVSGKTVYTFNKRTEERDTVRYIATTANDFTVAFDSADYAIFNRFDSIALQRPKGVVYAIPRQVFKGYKKVEYPVLY